VPVDATLSGFSHFFNEAKETHNVYIVMKCSDVLERSTRIDRTLNEPFSSRRRRPIPKTQSACKYLRQKLPAQSKVSATSAARNEL
jgi:hypothetical protein